jgi:hypothetical protein
MRGGAGALNPSVSPEENADFVKSLTENDRQFALLGLADKMLERLRKSGLNSDESKALVNNEWVKRQMRPFFKDEKDFNGFIESVANERQMHATKTGLMGGSQTAEKTAEDVSDVNAGVRAMSAAKIGMSVVQGRVFHSVGEMWRLYRDVSQKPDPKLGEALAKILFAPDITETEIGRRLAAGDTNFANPLARGAGAIQDVAAPAIAAGVGATQ